jgi:hypothetical protein
VPAAQKEKITFAISKERASTDAFFDIARLTADGKLDMDVYFGWDYHSEYHLKHSKMLFTWLKDQGFRAPVTTWDKLTPTSGAFTRTVKADGKTVNVEVRMYFGKPGTSTDPDTDAGGRVLEGLALESLAKRDVIIYSGHSGPFYGFALANWKKTEEGDLDDADIRVARDAARSLPGGAGRGLRHLPARHRVQGEPEQGRQERRRHHDHVVLRRVVAGLGRELRERAPGPRHARSACARSRCRRC